SKPEQFVPWLKISLEKFLWQIKKERLKIIFQNLSRLAEPEIKKILAKDVSRETAKLLAYPISTGGKRLRPGMAILSCLAMGGKLENVIQPATGLEILHNYTLIVDDTIDHSLVRRGEPTSQKKYGHSISECLAVDYATSIFQSIENHPQSKIISDILARTLKIIFEGEILDILFEQAGREDEPYIKKNRYLNISRQKYLKMISQKTAILFQTAVEIGAICANAKSKQVEALKNYGLNLGIAFQIRDDILDIFGNEKKFGKKIGKDIEERKGGNIVILLANQELSKTKQKILAGILKKKTTNRQDIKQAIQMIKKTKAKGKAQNLGEEFIKKAKKCLEVLPQNKWTNLLKEIAEFVIEREY
ncbi:MAG TPA: polyprenyl synthetase family protein, partial [Candidatus Portnoybacteria bacterium]|nr:polyprenyl synthetase family protein [Candidatus Portnoybacteria bacterium]